jgi:hypothetical protein
MTHARAVAIVHTAAEELRGAIVCACALSLIFAASWQPF